MTSAMRMVDFSVDTYSASPSASSVSLSGGSVVYLAALGMEAARSNAKLYAKSVYDQTGLAHSFEELDDEVNVRWVRGNSRAVASFEKDGSIGYAMLIDGVFVPGAERVIASRVPKDLVEYLR